MEDELELVANIDQMWSDLFTESRQVDRSLTDVKKSFKKVRQKQKMKSKFVSTLYTFHTLLFLSLHTDYKRED